MLSSARARGQRRLPEGREGAGTRGSQLGREASECSQAFRIMTLPVSTTGLRIRLLLRRGEVELIVQPG